MHLLKNDKLNGGKVDNGKAIHFVLLPPQKRIMQNNPNAFQDAVARARQIAEKLSASAPGSFGSSNKRPNADDDYSNKRPNYGSSNQASDIPAPVLRAQLVAQQINSQLGVKSTGDSMPLSNQLTCQEDYKIPDKYVGLIIGKGGEQITRIQAESGCKVQICQMRPDAIPGAPNAPDRVANLSGSRDAIDRARRIMDDIVSRGRTADSGGGMNPYSMGGPNAKSIELMMPSAKCGLVIGKGGETIKRVSEEFNIKMYVGQEIVDIDGIEHKPLKLTGEPDKIERAKQYVIENLLKSGPRESGNRFNSNQSGGSSYNDYGSRNDGAPMTGPCNEASYHVPYDKAGIIIGKGGENIKEINRKSGAFVELDKSHVPAPGLGAERLFKLRGTPEQIVTAQQLMYDKVANSAGGAADMVTPIQFQQQHNLPLMGSGSMNGWGGGHDQYGADPNGAAAADPYSQWAAAYGQWPQMNPYDNGASTSNSNASATDPATAAAMSQMDPAWLAYYQSMNFYSMMQSSMTGATSSAGSTETTTSKPTDSTAASSTTSSTSAVNSSTGQADYSQQWIEYYRSMGQNDVADEIARQMKEPSASTSTSSANTAAASAMMGGSNPWAAYAQQWSMAANGNGSTAATNGSSAPSVPSS